MRDVEIVGCRRGGALRDAGVGEHAGDEELELQTRRGGPGHLVERGDHEVGRPREAMHAEGGGLSCHALELVVGDAAQNGRGPRAGGGHDDQIAQALEQVVDEAARVLTGLHDTVDRGERPSPVSGGERVDDLVEELGVRVAQQRDGSLVAHEHVALGIRVAAGDELVEQRQRVAGRPSPGADDERQHSRFDADALALAELLHVLEHGRGRDEAERIVMGARADGAEHLLGLGGREDELHVRGGLFDELQQGVEPLLGDHVRLIEDEDLEAVAGGREDGPLPQVARVVDAVVARRVDLDDVEGSAAAATELDAAVAHAAGGVGGTGRAVEAARQNAGRRGLSAAARTGEQIRVTHAVAAQGGHERFGHLRLPDHLAERLGAVSAVQGCRHPSSLRRPSDIAPVTGPDRMRAAHAGTGDRAGAGRSRGIRPALSGSPVLDDPRRRPGAGRPMPPRKRETTVPAAATTNAATPPKE